ncbi:MULTISPECIES: glycerol-3-phosphate dehydrogenase/oxidase [unclassified Streptomyces]|uniref:glycerol-3-phosphate dehydrogenase/oxidase n=1 Tax=unclassified Streptomyces TaxID=2593676 RepID=UPI0022B6E975|nr:MULTISPECIES: glycerol-3-phosphate dehydrogenase/oxidase [unclassified Streptomyces]MCZ7416411.1 glycerol-3-phosphate dehydrogenase/oxidase [Streptomyces sp. WMMC897]MCZ7433779.1 glycerol-3-phosphate dehydrogenase/oxidase [Streptomyces sp. WMMC1477]
MNTPDPRTSLNAARRTRELHALGERPHVDLLVVGGGVTGAGIALDAASRGLSVVLAEKHDLAFGTSRWSSKLVHGGLRYLATGQLGIAHESARERHLLITRTAPHLVRALPMLLPLHDAVGRLDSAVLRAGFLLGDALRLSAGTPGRTLPAARRVSRRRALDLAPGLRPEGLRGGHLAHDGQLVDDARLVVALARTAAGHGARVLTRCGAEQLRGDGAVLRDELTGERLELRASAVVNATGVWAGQLVPDVRLSPSRGSHLVLPGEAFGGLRSALTIPVPRGRGRFALVLPQPDGRVYAGLTDEPQDGPVPDVPRAPEDDVTFLLDAVNTVLARPLTRADVLGTFAGLRPLLRARGGDTADLSRRHAVLTSADGVITVVGGKLTTYRRMAEDAVDTAAANAALPVRPCRTRNLPLVGAGTPAGPAGVPARLVARYGTEAPAVLAEAAGRPELLNPVAAGVTGAELRFAVRHEGALDEADLLERRTRIALVPEDREAARAVARALLTEDG